MSKITNSVNSQRMAQVFVLEVLKQHFGTAKLDCEKLKIVIDAIFKEQSKDNLEQCELSNYLITQGYVKIPELKENKIETNSEELDENMPETVRTPVEPTITLVNVHTDDIDHVETLNLLTAKSFDLSDL